MLIYTKNINDINIEDIDNLIAKKQIESKFLEFKQQKSNGEEDKILKTVCGFANADGGLFIYGLKEKMGKHMKLQEFHLMEKVGMIKNYKFKIGYMEELNLI